MKVEFKGETHEVVSEDELKCLLETIDARLQATGEVITSVEGPPTMSTGHFHSILLSHLAGGNSEVIQLISQNATGLASETLDSVREYVPKLLDVCERVAEPFYSEPRSEDWALLDTFIQGLQWLLSALDGSLPVLKMSSLNLVLAPIGLRLQPEVGRILSALEEKNYVLAADVITYELDPILRDLLDAINQEAKG